jgi:UbiD family decarboxylase
MIDLRSFLRDHARRVCRIGEPVSVDQEITALQHEIEHELEQPVFLVEKPVRADGKPSNFPVVTNLCADRQLVAEILGFPSHRDAARELTARIANPIAPIVVAASDAPVQQVVRRGADANLFVLPALRQHDLDAGPYITAGHCTMANRDSGIDNTSIQRCLVKESRLMSIFPYPNSHNARNVESFWRAGEPCPVAIWIGHHPSIVIGSQAKLTYPQSHWAAAGGFSGAPLRLVPSVTHGERIMVPADAEIVIEGFIPPNRLEADGPFGEYTGYFGEQIAAPVLEVSCITHRKDAIYHDIGAGLPDHLVPDNMQMEAKIFGLVRGATPSAVNVHVPYSGRRFHAYVQFRDPPTGEVRDALTAALSFRRLRTVIAVDEDIDIFNDSQVMWALATRVQWHRDKIEIGGLTHPSLDPSRPLGATTVTKVAIDATLPAATGHGLPRPFLPNLVAAEGASARAKALLTKARDAR